jgi:hypothetical protein
VPRFIESPSSISLAITPCLRPNLQAAIRAKVDGPAAGQRTWTVRVSNTGTAPAAAGNINSIVTALTAGPGPVSVATATPVTFGDIRPGTFKDVPIVLNFPLTVPETWISIKFGLSANAGAYTATRQINSQRR